MLDAVIFDFNGVLVDDEDLHLQGFNAALRPYGLEVSPEAYLSNYLGFDDRGAFSAIFRDARRELDSKTLDALIEAKAVVYERLAETELSVFDGAVTLLQALSTVAPIAIVSGALRREINLALRHMGCESLVSVIIAAEDVTACKPDPEGYVLGLRALRSRHGELSSARVVVIEDSPAGVTAAVRAELIAVGVAHTYPSAKLTAAGARCVHDRLAGLTVGALASLTL